MSGQRTSRARASAARLAGVLVLGVAASMARPVRADVSSVTTTPAAVNVAATQATTVAMTWNMVRDNTGTVGPTVTSDHGVFRAGSASGPVLGVVNQTLSATKPVSGTSTVFTIPETVTVPVGVAYQAVKLGVPTIVYVRTFNDCTTCTPGSGAVVLPLTGGGGAVFSVSRLSLRFGDDTAVRVVAQGAKLRAYADLTFTGGGVLKGEWQVASPPSTLSKKPDYRTLAPVSRALAGGERVRIKAPALPTQDKGIYLVRLRIVRPALPVSVDELPFIRYVVSSEPAGQSGSEAPADGN
ncbi:MAG TPA: hypothetical protein VKA50_15365 [Gammaproteobacteria bacterium]|nr:hypothetical protein [Gammaproteobacteria bacterium]